MSEVSSKKSADKSLRFVIISVIIIFTLVIGIRIYEFKKYDEPITLSAYPTTAQTVDKITVNINTADLDQLCELPQIGEILAQRIIDYREQYGAFEDIEEIKQVKGIGNAVFSAISPLITV